MDASPEATDALVRAMQARYGLSAADLLARLAKGRFRVKANCDRATADAYARDLLSIGARTRVEEARPSAAVEPASAPDPVSSRVAQDAAASGGVAGARHSMGSALAPAGPRTSTPQAYTSGLSAAFGGGGAAPADLGALASEDFALASLDGDGEGDEPPARGRAGAQPVSQSASQSASQSGSHIDVGSIGPPARPILPSALASAAGRARSPSRSNAESRATVPGVGGPPILPATAVLQAGPMRRGPAPPPTDRFAPPGEAEIERPVELHRDELADQARRRAIVDQATADPEPGAAGAGSSRSDAAGPPPSGGPGPAASSSLLRVGRPTPARMGLPVVTSTALADPPRWHYVAGIVLAVVLGFLPAHVVTSLRERSAYSAIDRNLQAAQAAVVTPADYDALDGLRASALAQKYAARHSIAIGSIFLWLCVGGGLAFLWFRRLPWERFVNRRT